MKDLKQMAIFMMVICLGILAGCGGTESAGAEKNNATEAKEQVSLKDTRSEAGLGKLKIIVGDKVFYAALEDNATVRAFIEKLPTTLPMENLYGREMCYRYGAGGLAAAKTRSDRYEVGDIVYWPTRGSFVILYKQNGEEFERVQLGHIDGDVSFFNGVGDMDVKFEPVQP